MSASPPACFALIPAAGTGSRAGASVPKQYLPIAGRAMLSHTVAAFSAVARIEAVVVVVAPEDRSIDAVGLDPARTLVVKVGGATRAATVANGLAAIEGRVAAFDWMLVHDAARCGIDSRAIASMIEALDDDPVGGLMALPVADTLKRADGDRARETVDRRALWSAQTPQMFRYRALRDALERAGNVAITDEAGAMEAAGYRPRLVAGSPRNFKVTTRADLDLMTLVLESATP